MAFCLYQTFSIILKLYTIKKINNIKSLKGLRKKLRNHSTSAECILWKALHKRQLAGRKFRRQHSIENYIVDFYCPREKLVIELDGPYHSQKKSLEYDQKRTEKLEALGCRVLRFKNKLVLHNLDHVLKAIIESFPEYHTTDSN